MFLAWLVASSLTAALLSLADAAGVSDAGSDSLGWISVGALIVNTAAGLLLATAFSHFHRLDEHLRQRRRLWRYLVRAGPPLALAGAVLALNADALAGRLVLHPAPGILYVQESPVPTWLFLALVGSIGVAFALFWALLRGSRGRRRVAIALGVGAGAGLAILNSVWLPGLYARQHWTLTLLCWLAFVPTLHALVAGPVGRLKRPQRRWIALVLVALILTWTWRFGVDMGALSPGARLGIRHGAPNAAAALRLFDRLLDVDGDGAIHWFDGGDCAPMDSSVAVGALEVAGDGVDQNCFGGDPDPADVEELARRLAGQRRRAPQPERRNLLLVTVDAWRADTPMPATEEWLRPRCTQFSVAYCAIPHTEPSLFATFRSTYPIAPRAERVAAAPALAEIMRDAGYRTAGFVFWPAVLDLGQPAEGGGPGDGFSHLWVSDDLSHTAQARSSRAALEQAFAWLRQHHQEAWFVWVHLYNPHAPFMPHRDPPPDDPVVLYRDEVLYADAQLRAFVDSLGERDDVVVALTADHGEALGEHGAWFHNSSLFDEQVRVPLWLCPGPGPGEVLTVPVSQLDLAPTLLDMAGVDGPRPAGWEGRSLMLDVTAPPPLFALVDYAWGPVRAVVVWPWKLIYYREQNVVLLHNLEVDPDERYDRSEAEPELTATLARLLDAWMALERDAGHADVGVRE